MATMDDLIEKAKRLQDAGISSISFNQDGSIINVMFYSKDMFNPLAPSLTLPGFQRELEAKKETDIDLAMKPSRDWSDGTSKD